MAVQRLLQGLPKRDLDIWVNYVRNKMTLKIFFVEI